jgi:hypothetical protein
MCVLCDPEKRSAGSTEFTAYGFVLIATKSLSQPAETKTVPIRTSSLIFFIMILEFDI